MSIDRIKKVAIVCPAAAAQRLLKALHALDALEVTSAFDQIPDMQGRFDRAAASTEECDRQIQKIRLVQNLLNTQHPLKKSFVAGLAPVPLVIESGEVEAAETQIDIDSLHCEANELEAEYRHNERVIGEVQNQLRELEPLRDLPFHIADLGKPKRIRVLYGKVPEEGLDALAQAAETGGAFVWERVVSGRYLREDGSGGTAAFGRLKRGAPVYVVAAFLVGDDAAARKTLATVGFEEQSLPHLPGTVRDHIRELQGDLAEYRDHQERIRKKVAAFLPFRRAFDVLEAAWEDRKRLALARTQGARGRWVHMLTGYVRERDVPRIVQALEESFPEVSMTVADPEPGEDVPVSLSLPSVLRPIQMLTNLFGLPAYNTFDPSPFIFFPFLLFFGICFSDVAYGAMLIALSAYIMYKTRPYAGVYNFAKLLLYGGISTVIFGFLLGSWFGDLYTAQYLGEDNLMLRIMNKTKLIDPLEKPIAVLIIALGIGMLNQFFGIALKMYSALLRGDKAEALCDALLWLIILPGFVVLIASAFAAVPRPLMTVALVLFIIGAIGLVLTQGRSAPGLFGKTTTGILSLYGIVGSYGLTAFVGDTMSYCRLLALALTTGIVALSFNMMAGLLREIPVIGGVLFVAALIAAHVFNFLISVLGAFVHSMRLIFVEFFGRFYAAGSRPFSPLGFDSRTAVLRKHA